MNRPTSFHLLTAISLTAATLLGTAAVCRAQEADKPTVEKTKHRVIRVEAAGGEDQESASNRRIVRVYTAPDDPQGERRSEVVFVGESGPGLYEHALLPLKRGYLGVQLIELTPELRAHFGAPDKAGVMVSYVAEDSPAHAAGLRVGDLLTAIDQRPVATSFDVARQISDYEDGAIAQLEVWRDRRVRTITATIATHEKSALDLGLFVLPDADKLKERIAIDLENLPEHVIEIDEEGITRALRDFQTRFSDPGMLEKFRTLEGNRLDLQERIRELEKRLEELEVQLRKLPEK